MSAVTTARFQHINDLKALRSNLQMKYEQSQPGAAEGLLSDDAESKEIKAMSSRLFELESEASNTKFKHGMEMNKLKLELKDSKKDFDDLKRFVAILESKLGSFIQDSKDNGIKTNIAMDDMPEITVFGSSSGSRRASILSTDNPLQMVREEEFSPPTESAVPTEQTEQGISGAAQSEKMDVPPNMHNMSHSTINTHLSHSTDQAMLDPLHLPPSGIPPQSSVHHQHLQHLQQQQAQLMHYRDQVSAHSSYSQIYGVPISDSGLSSHTASHSNLPPGSSHYGGHPHYHPYNHHYPGSSEEMHLVSSYGKPVLSKEERYYKNQFKAVKELILATMDCKDIATLEPEGLQVTKPNDNAVNESQPVNVETEQSKSVNANTNDKPMNLRHRNRDLYHNMQKVKEVEKIAMNYADFCVNNAVNIIDSAAYDKFQAAMFESELDRFHGKAAALHSVEVQTDIPTIHHPYANSGFSTQNTSVNNSPNANIRKSSVFGASGKLTPGRKRTDSFLLRSQSERVRTPNTADSSLHHPVRVSTSRNGENTGGLDNVRPTSALKVEFKVDHAKPDDTNDRSVKSDTWDNSVKDENSAKHNSDGPVTHDVVEQTRVRTPVDTSPKNMLLALKQLREEAAQEAEDDDDLAMLTEMELPASAPLIDFGDILLPTLYSSTGRRQSLSLVNPIKAQSFRDPALDFLDIQEANEGENEDDPIKDSFGPGLLLASKTPSFRKSFLARKDSNSGMRPVSGGSTKGIQDWGSNSSSNTPMLGSPQVVKHKSISNMNKPPSSGIPFSDTLSSNIVNITDEDVTDLKDEMKTLMDKKLLALYTALDNRWQGLDSTNTGILQKLNRFQEAIVGINEDNQRILGLNQALAVRMSRVESRMYEALEPVYIALQHNRDGVESLEALMVDVAEKLDGLKEPQISVGALLPPGMAPNPQLPVEALLRGGTTGLGSTYAASGSATATNAPPRDYHIDEVLAPRPAAAMSEYELESVFRQLREYSSLYKDMVSNYNHLMKRLKEEDARRSGNFALKKPHLPGTVEVSNASNEFIFPNNNMEDAYQTHAPHNLPSSADTGNPREPDGQNSRFPNSYPSPHRVILPTGKNGSSMVNKRDIQLCVEKSDLSANIEIVRMKNDIARLSHALGIRDTSPSRQRGALPPTTFPSLFSTLDNGEFTVLSTLQSQPDGQSVLSYLPPTSPSGRVLRSSGGTRHSAEFNAHGLFVAPSGHSKQHRIPLEFSLNDELKSLSQEDYGEPSVDLTNTIRSIHNDTSGVRSYHSNTSVNELLASSHNSILQHIRSTPDGGYSIGGAEEDVGLDTHSLSPYEFLLNPPLTESQENIDGAAEAVNPHTSSSDKVITPGMVPVRPSVAIVHAPAEVNTSAQHNIPSRPKSRSVMWGSSANIHTNLNPLQREASFNATQLSSVSAKEPSAVPASPRKSVVNNVPATSPAVPKRKSMTTSREVSQIPRNSGSKTENIRKMDVIARADEIIHANNATNASGGVNNVRTGMVPNPTPPAISRPAHANPSSNTGAHNKAPRRSVTDKNSASTAVNNPSQAVPDVDTSAIWRSNYPNSDSVGHEVAATPSILLQPGEYVPSGQNFPNTMDMSSHNTSSVPRSRDNRREQIDLDGTNHTVSSLESDSVVGGAFVE
eukprot:gene13397-15425_t